MKNNLMALWLCSLFALGTGCGLLEPSPEEQAQNSLEMAEKLKAGKIETALEYNNGLVGLETELMGYIAEFEKTKEGDPKGPELLDAATKNCEASLELLKAHKPYPGGGDMKKAAVKLFESYLAVLQWSGKLTHLDSLTDEQVGELVLMEPELMSAVETATSEYQAAQEEFARAEEFQLLEQVEVSAE